MYLIITRGGNFKCDSLDDAIQWLHMSGVGDTGGAREAIAEEGEWYSDGQGCGIEERDGRELKNVEWTYNSSS